MHQVAPGNTPDGLHGALTDTQTGLPSPHRSKSEPLPSLNGGIVQDAPRRGHLSTPKHNFEVLASRTVSRAILEESRAGRLPSSPLDSIDPSLYPRFPRFSITTESSHPDLSTDEVTSTKISLDEEGMVATRRSTNISNTTSNKRQKLHITLQRAVSNPSLGLRRFGDRIKRVPSILLSRRLSTRPHRSASENHVGVIPKCNLWRLLIC